MDGKPGERKRERFQSRQVPFRCQPKAMIIGQRDGFVKVISEAGSGEILGIHIFGHQATELIAEAAVALKSKAGVADVAATIHAHPSLSEPSEKPCWMLRE